VRAAASGQVATPPTVSAAGAAPTLVAAGVAPTIVSRPATEAAAAARSSPSTVAPPSRSRPRGKLALGAAVLAAAALAWGVSASQRGPRTDPVPPDARASRLVTREEPGVIGRLLGSPAKVRITVPEGSSFRVRLETPLSSETARPEQPFTASTGAPVLVEGHEAFPAGTQVRGHVSHAAGSGKVSGRGELTLEFDRIRLPGGAEVPIEAEPLQRRARSGAKKDAVTIGGAAGAGAIVGGILGGKKGAAIGGAVGGTAGTGVVLATKGEEVVLPEGATLDLRLRSPVTVTVEAPR
jgi:hypothetical protein